MGETSQPDEGHEDQLPDWRPPSPRLTKTFIERLAQDRGFLAAVFHDFRDSEGLTDEAVANYLAVSVEQLHRIALCRVPDADRFAQRINAIAERYGADTDQLLFVVRRVQTRWRARELVDIDVGASAGMLAAARDRPVSEEPRSRRTRGIAEDPVQDGYQDGDSTLPDKPERS